MRRGMVLGASSGVGAALVEQLAAAGDEVLAVSRRALAPSGSGRVSAVAVDIRDFEALAAAVAAAQPLDYLVNCVGVGFYAPIGSDNTEAWQEILDTNLRGLLNLVSIVERDCPELADLVQVSSLAAHRPSATPGNLAYSVAKAGGRTILQEFRRELRRTGRRTRVSMVSPGFVEGTGFGEHFFSRRPAPPDSPAIYPDGGSLTPAEVAGVIGYVLDLPRGLEVLDLLLSPTNQPT